MTGSPEVTIRSLPEGTLLGQGRLLAEDGQVLRFEAPGIPLQVGVLLEVTAPKTIYIGPVLQPQPASLLIEHLVDRPQLARVLQVPETP